MSATIAIVAVGTVVPAGFAGAVTSADLQAQINALLAQLQTLQGQLGTTTTGGVTGVPAGFTFAKTLAMGSTGADVKNLQIVLNSDSATMVAATGAGSKGKETTKFGPATKAAVVKFQEKYASSILTPAGLSKGTGLVGAGTRAKLNAMLGAAAPATTPSTTPTTTPGTTPTVVPTTNAFTVMLASDTAAAGTVVAGQSLAALAKFTFSNGTGDTVKVTNVKLKRLGVSNDTTFSNVYLFDGATRITDAASVTTGVITFNISSGIFSVAANSSKTVTVYVDIATGTSGQTVGVGINAAADITAGTTTASGSFPVNGNLATVATATLATVDFNTTSTPAAANIVPQNDYSMWQNIVQVGTRAVNLNRISIRQIGSVRTTDLQNLRLFVDGVQIGSAIQNLESTGYVTFDLSASPKKLETGNRTLQVKGDIIGGSNLNFQFSLRNAADVTFTDSQFIVNILSTRNSLSFSAATTGIQSVLAGTVTVTLRNDSPAGDVVSLASGVTLAKYDVKAAGEPVKIENLIVTVDSSRNAVGRLRNGALFANGVQIGSTADLYELDSATASTTYNLGGSLIVQPGSPVLLEVRADIFDNDGTNSLVAADTLQVRLNTGSSNGFNQVSNTTINVPTGNTTANTVTVRTGSLTLSKYTGFAGPTYVVPQTIAKMGHFTVTSTSTEPVNLTDITFDYVTGTATNITNVYAKYGTDTTTTKATISATGNNFSVSKTMTPGQSMDIIFYGNIVSETGNAEIQANVTGTTTGSATTVYGAAANTAAARVDGQLVTYGTGTFTPAKDGSTPLNGVIAANSTVTVGAFKFSAQNDTYTVKELKFRVGTSVSNAISSAILKDGATVIQTRPFDSTGAAANDTVFFQGMAVQIPANTVKVLTVDLVLADVAGTNSAASGAAIQLTLKHTKYATSAGAETTDTTTNPASNTSYVFEGYPTFTANTLPATTFTALSQATFASFKVKANGSPIALKQLKFKVAFGNTGTATALKVDQFKLFKNGIDITANVAIQEELLGNDITGTASAVSETTSPAVFVLWTSGNEDAIAASAEPTYELKGVPGSGFTGSTSGPDSVSFQLTNAADSSSVVRYYLAKTTAVSTSKAYNLATTVNQTTGTAADVIWSDMSGGNASAATTIHSNSNTASTGDWHNGYLLLNLPLPSRGLTVQ